MQLIESGESREKRDWEEKNAAKKKGMSSVQSLRDSRAVENVHSSSLHPPPERRVSRKCRG